MTQEQIHRKAEKKLPKAQTVKQVQTGTLQHAMGNQELSHYLFSNFQVSSPTDTSEIRAEHAADEVMAGQMQNKPEIARQEDASAGGGSDISPFGLPEPIKEQMEGAFAQDFDDVRVHHDREADTLAQGLHAAAFTQGKDIYFQSSSYHPESPAGQHLIAHELAHVSENDSGTLHRAPLATPSPATPSPADQTNMEAEQIKSFAKAHVEFKTFMDLIKGKSQLLREAANETGEAIERSGWDMLREGVDYVDDAASIIGSSSSIASTAYKGQQAGKPPEEIAELKEAQGTSDDIAAGAGVVSAGAGTVNTGYDMAAKGIGLKHDNEMRRELGLEKEHLSAKDWAEMAGDTIGVAGSWTGVGESFEQDEGTADKLGIASGSLAMAKDLFGIGTSSADVDEHRKNNNQASQQITALLNKAYGTTNRQDIQGNIEELKTLTKKDDNEPEFSQTAGEIFSMPNLAGNTKKLLQRAVTLNKTRQVTRQKRNESGWDVGLNVTSLLANVSSLIGTALGNTATGRIFSISGSAISAAGSLVSGIKRVIDDHTQNKRKNEANDYAKGLLENMADIAEDIPGSVQSEQFDGIQAPQAPADILAGQVGIDCYNLLDIGNVNILDFMMGLKGSEKKRIKTSVMKGYVKH